MKTLALALLLSPAISSADAIDDFVNAEMKRLHIPGMTLGIVQKGKVIRSAAYGIADVELNTPVTIDSVFEIGSVTKQFTAFATMMLVEEGKLRLDDSVSKYVPELPETWKGVTIRHALYQNSGLPEYAMVPGIGLVDSYDRKTWFEKITAVPVDFAPGTAWAYSNTNYALLGFVIEKVAGKPYAEFMAEKVLTPLGMKNSVYVDPYMVVPNRAHGFIFQGGLARAPYSGQGIVSDGTLASTIADMAVWDNALREKKLLKPESYAMMWSPAKTNAGHLRAYGTGWFLSMPWEPEFVAHHGASSGYSSAFVRYKKDDTTIILLANLYSGAPNAMAKTIAGMFDPALKSTNPSPVASDPDKGRTDKIKAALAKVATDTKDNDLLEPDITVNMGTARSRMGPNPFASLAKVAKMEFAGTSGYGDDTWITYLVTTEDKRDLVVRALWTPTGKVAQVAMSPVIK